MGRSASRILAVALATLMTASQPALASHANVTAVKGSGLGYWSDEISLFGGGQSDVGPTPTVSLATDASNSPLSASAPCGVISYGPATLFTADTITLNTSGSLGAGGSVTSTSSVANINQATTASCNGIDLTTITGSEVFTASSVTGTATAATTGTTGSTTVTGGTLRTHAQAGTDCTSPLLPCGRAGEQHTHDLLDPEAVVSIPANPPVNHKVAGHLHLGDNTTDYFVVVFNQQSVNPDGSITVNPVHEYLGYKLDGSGDIVPDLPLAQGGSVLHGHLYLGQVAAGATTAAGSHDAPSPNFDGDNDTDRAVFRNGAWYAEGQNTEFLGQGGDLPVPADYDGDGDDDRAVYRDGTWYLEGQDPIFHGDPTDMPVPADYDDDGDADVAIYRPSVGGWYVMGQPTVFYGGFAGDIPVPADYDNDGDADPAIWRPDVGGWYVLDHATQFLGLSGDIPVPGDYDGDGDAERAVWRPSAGGWYVEGQATAFVGLDGDRPQPGDYDGDGDTDRAIWRPSVGGWYTQNEGTVFLGLSSDVPLSLPNAVYRFFF